MFALTGSIAVGKGKAAIATFKGGCIPNDLEHETRQSYGVRFRALAIHDKIRVRHMVFVVLAVEVYAIPARPEHEFKPYALGAARVKKGLVGNLMAEQGRFRGRAVVQAVDAHSTRFQINLVCLAEGSPQRLGGVRQVWVTSSVCPSSIGSRDHAEPFGESGNVVSVKKVVANPKLSTVRLLESSPKSRE